MAASICSDIIDAHLHVYDLEFKSQIPNQNWSHGFPPENSPIFMNITQEMAKSVANQSGVKKAVFVMCYDDSPEEAQWVYDNAQKTSFFVAIVAGLNITKHAQLAEKIDQFRATFIHPKFAGIRHHINYDEDLLFSEDFQRGLSILEEKQVPFDLGINDKIVKHIPALAGKFPKLKMVIDHLAKPEVTQGLEYLEQWKQEMSEAAKFPNVHMKLSGLVVLAEPWSKDIVQPFVQHCIKAFGPSRCMFGSDWPVCRLAQNTDYADVLQLLVDLVADLDHKDQQAIFHDSASAFYGL